MKTLTALLCCMACMIHAAETNKVTKLSPEEIQERMLKNTGGLIEKRAEGPTLMLIDFRSDEAGNKKVQETASLIGQVLRVGVKNSTSNGKDPVKEVTALLATDKTTGAVIGIVDQPEFASLLLAPENRWGIVNVSNIYKENTDALTKETRMRKEIWRAIGILMGAGYSGSPQCPFRPVFKPEDLDTFAGFQVTPATMAAVSTYCRTLGITQSKRTTYKKACEEGWAAMPTNHYQKAIWEEVKAKKTTLPKPTVTK
jgi:hypothetical protein